MIPKIQKWSDEYFLINIYAKPSEDRVLQDGLINESLYNYVQDNISSTDNVVFSADKAINNSLKVKPASSLRIDTIELPKDYLVENEIINPPNLEYFFIHVSDLTDKIKNPEIEE